MTASRANWEWPTLLLIAAVYAALFSLVWFHASIPWWLILPVGAYAAALHSSLQHEALHGHPTRSRHINEALVILSPTFWLPYGRYRDYHLQHHNDAYLTDPERDPESYYMLPESWARVRGIKRALFAINQTLAGRMLIGPAVSICRLWANEFRNASNGGLHLVPCWIKYVLASTAVIWFVVSVCGMPFWQYYFFIAYPGISLALIRSYCEHRAVEDVAERTIIVEASPFWSLLFLNNNLHVAHHTRPSLPWYKLPAYYRGERESMLRGNNGYLMRGYGEIFRRYFLTSKEPIAHPNPDWLNR